MKKTAYFSDIIFTFTVVFLPLLCYLRYLSVPLLPAFLCAALAGVAVALFAAAILQKRSRRAELKSREQAEAEKLALHFALLTPYQAASFFKKQFAPFFDSQTAEIKKRQGRYFLESEEFFCYLCFTAAPLSSNEALPLLSALSDKKKALFCNRLSGEAEEFLRRFDVQTVTIEEIYLALKSEAALPETLKGESAFSKKRKRRFSLWLKKSNSSRFLLGGAMLLLSSLFVPFPYYYLIFGGILVLSAALVRVFGYR
ncbi:MAG: hypothetical protein IJX98_03720 [Clostridia bacterium]|nr:hypothetical protein [Clostridia bacterium]